MTSSTAESSILERFSHVQINLGLMRANIHSFGSPTGLSRGGHMSPTTRRSFLKAGLAAGAMATVGTLPISAKRTATDTVMLGRSKMEVTRLAF